MDAALELQQSPNVAIMQVHVLERTTQDPAYAQSTRIRCHAGRKPLFRKRNDLLHIDATNQHLFHGGQRRWYVPFYTLHIETRG